jgi:RNA polymerase sigma-70 factor (ECF subfamily)
LIIEDDSSRQATDPSLDPRMNLASRSPAPMAGPLGRVVRLPLPDSDVALVAALGAGRLDARGALFDRYGGDVERVLYRILGPDADIPDLLQDVFVVGLTSLHRLQNPQALKSWLIGIAIRKARKLIAKRRRWRFIQVLPSGSLPEIEAPFAPAEVSEALRCAYAVLERLPADERVVFTLRQIEGMELTAIAEACETSLSTVKRRFARAQSSFLSLARDYETLSRWLNAGGLGE